MDKRNSIFHFKQFSVDDSDCAMKVGTDAILLACSVPKNQKGKMLDIGSGSGLLSLAFAQNNPFAEITAVEIDDPAYQQSLKNFSHSKWGERINAVHSSIQRFSESYGSTFENILCNPPFFKNNAHLIGSRKSARQDIHLTFPDLLSSVSKLIAPTGKFYCIAPYGRSGELVSLAKNNNLFPFKIINIKGKEVSTPNRSILSFSREADEPIDNCELVIYNEDNSYTKQYQEYTKDFYLKF